MDRTSSVPMSALRLCVDKGQGLQSGILFFTSLVLPPNECFCNILTEAMQLMKTQLSGCAAILCLAAPCQSQDV